MCTKANIQLPLRYITRRKSFYDDIQEILGEKVGFVRLINPKADLLIYPSNKSEFVIANHLSLILHNSEEHDDSCYGESDDIVPLENNILQELVHTVLHFRNDMENTPGHNTA